MAAAVLLVAGFVGRGAEGLFLAVADGGEAVGRNALAEEILFVGDGAAIAEREVVFGGAAFVAMAFDGDADLRIVAEELDGFAESVLGVSANIRLVVIEVGVTKLLEEEFVQARLGSFDDGRRRHFDGDAYAAVASAARSGSGDRIGGRVRRGNGRRALRRHRAHFRSDRDVGGVGSGPSEADGFALLDGGAIGADGGRGLGRGGRRSRSGLGSLDRLFVAGADKESEEAKGKEQS